MKLQHATWQEVERYLERATGIIIPIGSTEQHGPNGLLGTDAICPETVAWELGERHDVLVGPTQSLGMAQHHLAFPGSISLRPSTLIAVLHDTVTSLARHGFTHLFFLNGHGGNIATTQAAFAEIWADASLSCDTSRLHLKLGNWFAGPRVRKLAQELFGEADGKHATASEVSLTWHAYPDEQRSAELEPERAPDGPIRDAAGYRASFPDGRIASEPQRATREFGRRFYEAGLVDALEEYRQFTHSGDKARS